MSSPLLQAFQATLSAALPQPSSLPQLQILPKDGPVVLLFSPHPDDEIIVGALPLRLRREQHARVVNVAVTLGSKPLRREARHRELTQACALVDFEVEVLGWTDVTRTAKQMAFAEWRQRVGQVAALIASYRPDFVFYPHAHDGHPAHVGTHDLVREALRDQSLQVPCLVETEFWHPARHPNLMVESSAEDVDRLVAALSLHAGEVARNPYHRRLPAWMLDNTRRGGERIAGAGAPAPDFCFSTLYRIRGEDRLGGPWMKAIRD